MIRLVSWRGLPAWYQPTEDGPDRVSVFWQEHEDEILCAVFGVSHRGVEFLDLSGHREHGRTWTLAPGDRCSLPPEVLIAAGVEAMRRRG